MLYKIVRYFERGPSRTVKSGLYLEEAQAHCQDPETSSTTCTTPTGKRRTRERGRWFDGYEEMPEPKRRRRKEYGRVY